MSEYGSTMRSYANVLEFCSIFFLPLRSFDPMYAFTLRLLELLRFHHIVPSSFYTALDPENLHPNDVTRAKTDILLATLEDSPRNSLVSV